MARISGGSTLSVIQMNRFRLARPDPSFRSTTSRLFCGCLIPRSTARRVAQGAQCVPQRPERLYHWGQTVPLRSKTSIGGFYGFKLHLIINDTSDLLDVALTPRKTDGRTRLWSVSEGDLHGNLYGDREFLSKDLREKLGKQGINLVYNVRKNMQPLDLSVSDEVLLKKRMLIESVIRELKTQMQLEHTRHRSVENFHVNVFSALIAYQLLENKPTLNLAELQDISDLPVIF